MDNIDSTLATAIAGREYDDAIRASLKLGKDLLNKYYSLTDNSDIYRIAMGTHLITLWSHHYLNSFPSASPILQASLLRKSGLGGCVDQGSGAAGARGV